MLFRRSPSRDTIRRWLLKPLDALEMTLQMRKMDLVVEKVETPPNRLQMKARNWSSLKRKKRLLRRLDLANAWIKTTYRRSLGLA